MRITDDEYELMKKYREIRILDEPDRLLVEVLETRGLMHSRHLDTTTKPLISLTDKGRRACSRKHIRTLLYDLRYS